MFQIPPNRVVYRVYSDPVAYYIETYTDSVASRRSVIVLSVSKASSRIYYPVYTFSDRGEEPVQVPDQYDA